MILHSVICQLQQTRINSNPARGYRESGSSRLPPGTIATHETSKPPAEAPYFQTPVGVCGRTRGQTHTHTHTPAWVMRQHKGSHARTYVCVALMTQSAPTNGVAGRAGEWCQKAETPLRRILPLCSQPSIADSDFSRAKAPSISYYVSVVSILTFNFNEWAHIILKSLGGSYFNLNF